MLLVAGDFNSTLLPESGITGCGHLQHPHPPPDCHLLNEVVQQHSLCAANTWTCRRETSMHTYENGQQRTQIDYIFSRRQHADRISRNAKPIRNINSTPWRHGSRHLVLSLSLPTCWRKPDGHRRHQDGIQYDKAALDDAVCRQTSQCQELRLGVGSLANITAAYLNDALLQVCARVFPKKTKGETSQGLAIDGCAA